jgi:hypothetical protein
MANHHHHGEMLAKAAAAVAKAAVKIGEGGEKAAKWRESESVKYRQQQHPAWRRRLISSTRYETTAYGENSSNQWRQSAAAASA